MNPEYEIVTVDDFLKVPEDRIDDCLEEFKTALNTHRATMRIIESIASEVGEELPEAGWCSMPSFTWIDDGERNITVEISGKKTGDAV